MRILLDLDEVLADFVGPAAKLWGLTREQLLPHWTEGVWDMVPPMIEALKVSKEKTLIPYLNQGKFWDMLDSEDLWANLPRTQWFNPLLKLVDNLTLDWHIITSPIHATSCYVGKVKWIKRYFGLDFNRFAITPHKEIFAGPDVILIDDRDSTIEKFNKYGGKGIVFPAHHNSRHEWKEDPLFHVEKSLQSILGTL